MREDAIDFFRAANADHRIWSQLGRATSPPEIVKVAAANGYYLTVEDVEDLGRSIAAAETQVAEADVESAARAPARRRASFRLVAAGVLATSDACTEGPGTPVTCIVWPETFVGDTCNCTVFQPGCD